MNYGRHATSDIFTASGQPGGPRNQNIRLRVTHGVSLDDQCLGWRAMQNCVEPTQQIGSDYDQQIGSYI